MKLVTYVVLAAINFAFSSQANVVLLDSFNYPDGPLAGAPASPWTVRSGTTAPIQVTNGAIRLTAAGTGEDVSAPLSGAPYDTTNAPSVIALYASFKLSLTALPNAAGSYFAHFRDANLGFRARIYALTNGTDAAGHFRLAIGSTNSQSGSSGFVVWPSDLARNTTYKIVTRLNLADGASTLWIDPTGETDSNVTSTANPGTPMPVVTYAFRQESGIGTMLLDELKVGTSFADIAGANNSPTISSIPNQNVPANTTIGPLPITIGDAETPASDLTLTKASSSNALVPENNIIFGGSGPNRTVTITPSAGAQGRSTITLSVSDGATQASISFVVAVGLPSISDIHDQQTPVSTPTPPIPFTIGDAETPVSSLSLSANSSNPSLVPNENIVFAGSGANRTVTVTPLADFSGLTTITVTVSDGEVTLSDSFVLTVHPVFGVVASDDFNRPDGSLVFGSALWFSHSGTLSDTQVTNNQLRVSDIQTEDVSIQLAGGPYNTTAGTILYSSFTVNFTDVPTPSGGYFAHLKDSTMGFRGRIYAASANAVAGRFRLGIANDAATINANAEYPLDLSTGMLYTVVTRYNVGAGLSTLWINADSESNAGVDASDAPSPVAIRYYAFRQNTGIGTMVIDDLKVGGSFASVFTLRARLQIVKSGGEVQILWPASAKGFVLQNATDIESLSWATGDQGSVVGDRNVVRFSSPAGNRFFRLRTP